MGHAFHFQNFVEYETVERMVAIMTAHQCVRCKDCDNLCGWVQKIWYKEVQFKGIPAIHIAIRLARQTYSIKSGSVWHLAH